MQVRACHMVSSGIFFPIKCMEKQKQNHGDIRGRTFSCCDYRADMLFGIYRIFGIHNSIRNFKSIFP